MKTIQKEREVIDGIIESLEVSNGDAQSILEAYEMSHTINWKDSVVSIVAKVCE